MGKMSQFGLVFVRSSRGHNVYWLKAGAKRNPHDGETVGYIELASFGDPVRSGQGSGAASDDRPFRMNRIRARQYIPVSPPANALHNTPVGRVSAYPRAEVIHHHDIKGGWGRRTTSPPALSLSLTDAPHQSGDGHDEPNPQQNCWGKVPYKHTSYYKSFHLLLRVTPVTE